MTFWAMTGRAHICPANRSCDIFAPVGMEVCAGGHGMFVMKKVKGPAQAKLGRGTLQSWDGREVRAARLASGERYRCLSDAALSDNKVPGIRKNPGHFCLCRAGALARCR
jgi:hypothetical protein